MNEISRYKQIISLSLDAIVEIDASGLVVYANDVAQQRFGQPRASLLECDWVELWPDTVAEKIQATLLGALRGESTRLTAPQLDSNGQERWWLISTSPLTAADGNVETLVAVSRDITDRIAIEQALDTLNASLENKLTSVAAQRDQAKALNEKLSGQLSAAFSTYQRQREDGALLRQRLDLALGSQRVAEQIALQAQKGEAIGQLVAGVAHDFNNMLQTAVIGLSAVTDRPERLQPDQLKMLGYSNEALRHASTVAKRLLGFARAHRYEAQSLRLHEVAHGMADLIRHSLGSGIVLTIEFAEQADTAFADRHSIEQALMNLCINARDACGGIGSITVRFGQLQIGKSQHGVARAAGDYVTVTVADTGSGMDDRTKARLFEPYFTTKPEGHGTGLGLAQVYALLRQAGGFVDVQSTLGQGTVVTLAFPLLRETKGEPESVS